MKSTRDQIATLQAKQAKQSSSAIDRRDSATNAGNFARNTPTNAQYLSGAIPGKLDIKSTADKARKGK